VIPNVTRGGNASGVLFYLVGPGKRNEHEQPRLVAGSPEARWIAEDRVLERADAGKLGRFLEEPRKAFGTEVLVAERDERGRVVGTRPAHVWHCSLSLPPDEAALSDERWSEIAEAFVATMGFTGDDPLRQCRWVAVRHGESTGGSDHAHVVVGLVAEDGSKARVHKDFERAQRACRELEQRFGLQRLEARTRGTGTRATKPGERMADRRRGRDHGDENRQPGGQWFHERGSRETLERIVRGCGAASRTESEFVRALREHDVLVRPRYAEGGRFAVVGYSVRLPGPDTGPDRSIWFGGGRLARDLTLPSLRQDWAQDAGEQAAAVTEWGPWTQPAPRSPAERIAELEERAVSWHHCISEIDRLRSRLRAAVGDPTDTARAAHDAAGILAAWSVALEANTPGLLARSSRQLARSAEYRAARRPALGRPRPRGSVIALYLLAGARPDSTSGWFLLTRQLSFLGRELAMLHRLQGEVDRAREIETGLVPQLDQANHQLASRASTDPAATPADPERAARIAELLALQPPQRPDNMPQDVAARRVTDPTRRRRPRGR
jgi:hypothetical protein